MDQLLGAFGIDWKLLLAQAVNFAMVLVALRYFLYTPVMTALESRRQVVAKGVADAKKAEEKLAGADAEASKKVAGAEKEADEIVKSARAEASDERSKMIRDAEARAAQIGKDAEASAAETKDRAMRESDKEIARLAVLAAEKVLKSK